MEKVKPFLISLIAFSAFFSLYIGGIFVYPLIGAIVLYASFELARFVAGKRKKLVK